MSKIFEKLIEQNEKHIREHKEMIKRCEENIIFYKKKIKMREASAKSVIKLEAELFNNAFGYSDYRELFTNKESVK